MTSDRWARDPGPVVSKFFGGLRVRIAASALLLAGGVVFLLLYLAFLATRYSWYQNVAVLLSVGIIVPVGILVMWVLWGLGFARRAFRSPGDWE